MIKNQHVVCIGNTTWFGDYQRSSVQLLSRLGKNNKILYVDYAFTIKDVISGLMGKSKVPIKQILGLASRLDPVSKTETGSVVRLTLPPVIPFNHFKNDKLFRMALKINSFIIARSIRKAMKKLHMKDVISITSFMPFYGLFLRGKLKEKLNVYYCYDSIDGKRNGPRGKVYETEYMKGIDGVIVTSDNLASQKESLHPNVFIVKNGVDFDMFHRKTYGYKKPEGRKVVCYTGSIDQRFETEMIEYCIQNTPEYDYIFVGPVRNKGAAEVISKYANVSIKPPVPPDDIPLIMHNSHVGIIPYTRTHLNKNVYPLKINEYLAVGTPVVMTDFAVLPEFNHLVSVAPDEKTFLEKIKYEIEHDNHEKQHERVVFASNNSWESRTEAFSDVLQILLDMKNGKKKSVKESNNSSSENKSTNKTNSGKMLDSRPKLKKFIHYLMVHPYATRPRWWVRVLVYPLVIKRGKGSIIRRKARLDIIPSKKFSIGYRTIVEDYTIINNGMGDIIIGDRCAITSRVKLVGPVTLGNLVTIGSGAQITGLTHNFEDVTRPIKDQGVTPSRTIVEDDVWIGGNSVIIQGLRIGTHCIIASGSVVTRDVPPYSVVAGNPAKVIKQYNFETGKWEKPVAKTTDNVSVKAATTH